MKLKFLLPAILAAFVALAPSAHAEDIDMGKITCKEFMSSTQNEMTMLIFWIDGYLSGVSDNTMLTDAWLEELGDHLGSYCSKNGKHTIMQAIEAIQ